MNSSPHPATPAASFTLERQQFIEALNVDYQAFRHLKTGAKHIHLATHDPHNAFLVSFLTVPQDSTGVAHILEHTALCGSRRFPVRDPFFMMTRRSLNTFMNALTASDWTAYPFASLNRKDFLNLLDVYLDAAFFPNLHALDFAQEGHRLDFAQTDDLQSDLVFKGVVFNEMKGAMSSPVQRLSQTVESALFPSITYHYNSGGEPFEIPNLTHEQLVAFHRRHYHPSNAVFMTYGDLPACTLQDQFEEKVLQHFEALDVADLAIPTERRFTAPQTVNATYALAKTEKVAKKTHIVMGWLLGRNDDPKAVLQGKLLSDVLLDNSSSPLRLALETTKLGSAPSPLCGFDESTREMTFCAGLQGSEPEHAQAVEQLILETLQKVAEEGVPPSAVEAMLHQIELHQREITGDGFPYGLQLLMRGLTPALHGGDPVALLDMDELLQQIHQDIKNPNFIKDLCRQWLLENPHRVRVVLSPDTELGDAQNAAEKARLASLKAQLDDQALQSIKRLNEDLAIRQAQQDDPNVLPKVTRADVGDMRPFPHSQKTLLGQTPITFYAQGTNGLIYQQAIVTLPAMPERLIERLPLFSQLLTELGCGGADYLTVQAQQAAVCGALSARPFFRPERDDYTRVSGVWSLTTKGLYRNLDGLNQLFTNTFFHPRFDERQRVRELIGQLRTRRESSITGRAHSLAMLAANAGLSPLAAWNHRWDGLAGVQWIKQLDDAIQNSEDSLDELLNDFKMLHELLLNAPRQLLLVAEGSQQAKGIAQLTSDWTTTPVANERLWLTAPPRTVKEGWSTSTAVNFCAMAYPVTSEHRPDAPALRVLAEFLRNGYLHRAIREQGGAYGGGASYNSDTRSFRFYSYRDPRLTETLADFHEAVAWLQQTSHDDRSLEEAVLGVIGGVDKPGSPAGEAIAAFFLELFGRDEAFCREQREALLRVTVADLQRVAAQYLRPEIVNIAVVSSAERLKTTDLTVIAL